MKEYLKNYVNGLYAFKLLLCVFSIVILGISIAFNTKAALGTDAISVFFNGVSNFSRLNLGLATNIVNCILAIAVILIDKKYINVGTVIYVLTLGPSINWGIALYEAMNITGGYIPRFLISVLGILLAVTGLGIFISVNIGVDPWSALSIIFSKRLNKSFGFMKVSIDIIALLAGFLMGGKVREITLISALAGGPCIQKVSEFVDRMFRKML
ncbi:MAG: hypothetical protein LBR79_06270 [Oscillospiraceae bacterium]|nr:hypothetical protein [Oscillospiraceae bacterium]